MEKIKNFFSKLGKKFKENGKKLAFWFVLLVVSVTGFFYSFRAKNDNNLVSGSADEVTQVTFQSRPLEFEPILFFSTNSVFNYFFQLVDTMAYFNITKDYSTNTFSFSYDLYSSVENIIGNMSNPETPEPSLLISRGYSFDSLYPNGFYYRTQILSNTSSYAECNWLIRFLTLDFINSSNMSVAYSRLSSIVDYDVASAGITSPNYSANIPLFVTVSSFDFDPATIYKVDTVYTPVKNQYAITLGTKDYNMFSYLAGYDYVNYQRFFSQVEYIYYDENDNTFSINSYLMGNHFVAPDGSQEVRATRYLRAYTANYQDGYNDGYVKGEQDKQQAVNEAYNRGHSVGYNLGRGTPTYSFVSLLDAVGYSVTKPFASLLNFDLLGTNLLSLATGFISLVIIVKIIGLLI